MEKYKYKLLYFVLYTLFCSCDMIGTKIPEPAICFDPESSSFVEPDFNFALPDNIINSSDFSVCWERNDYCSEIQCKTTIKRFNGEVFNAIGFVSENDSLIFNTYSSDSLCYDLSYLDEGEYIVELQCRYDILSENINYNENLNDEDYAIYSETYLDSFEINAIQPNSIVLYPRYIEANTGNSFFTNLLLSEIEIDSISGSGVVGVHAVIKYNEEIDFLGYDIKYNNEFWLSIEENNDNIISDSIMVENMKSIIIDFSTSIDDLQGINFKTDTLLQLEFFSNIQDTFLIEFDNSKTYFSKFSNLLGTSRDTIQINEFISSEIFIK